MTTPQPTLETDTFAFGYVENLKDGSAVIHHHTNSEWADFARKLERERDEVQSLYLKLTKDFADSERDNEQLRKVCDELAKCLWPTISTASDSCRCPMCAALDAYSQLPYVVNKK